jgi:hypothetical protein
MLHLIVPLETVVCCLHFLGDDEVMSGWVKRPEVGAQDHDAEADVYVVVGLFHSSFELIREVLA